jgi:hypothetical protein
MVAVFHAWPGVTLVVWFLLAEEPLKLGEVKLAAPSPAKRASNHKYL